MIQFALMHLTTCPMLILLEASVWDRKFIVTHRLFPITIPCIFVKSTNICFTELFLYQLNFKLNISLLENAKFPQRDLVVTYDTVPAARMMCGVILSHATSLQLHKQPALTVVPRKPQVLEALSLCLCQNEFLLLVPATDTHSWALTSLLGPKFPCNVMTVKLKIKSPQIKAVLSLHTNISPVIRACYSHWITSLTPNISQAFAERLINWKDSIFFSAYSFTSLPKIAMLYYIILP